MNCALVAALLPSNCAITALKLPLSADNVRHARGMPVRCNIMLQGGVKVLEAGLCADQLDPPCAFVPARVRDASGRPVAAKFIITLGTRNA